MKYLSADIIYDGTGARYDDHVLVMDGQTVVELLPMADVSGADIQRYEGILLPGLINTHCHLELSHMLGKVPTGTGLLPFIGHVVKYRDTSMAEIEACIRAGDAEMYDNGIVAVGDISNKADTAATKDDSLLSYYTFVEMFDFLQTSKTAETIEQYMAVLAAQSDKGSNRKNLSPHAPYTVTPELMRYITSHVGPQSTISIHNQETSHENQLFVDGGGDFKAWYGQFGHTVEDRYITGQPSIYYAMQHLDARQRTLFVHNTMTTQADIAAAQEWSDTVYWATCPRANLYIENRLPVYSRFVAENAKVTIGTDSLTSNWALDIWAEVQTILKYASYLSIDQVITWATSNGAEALGYEDRLGSFAVGKQPGVNLVSCPVVDGQPVIAGTRIKKLL
jgi:cytosine/adenosine deaminase-related metal-dependent hydrolase